MFSADHANAIKQLLTASSLYNIFWYLQKAYPNEGCGLFDDKGIIYPANNAIDILNDKTLNTKNAFLIDTDVWNRAWRSGNVIGVYHSHTDGNSNISSFDMQCMPDTLYFLIVGILDHNPVNASLYWWEHNAVKSIKII